MSQQVARAFSTVSLWTMGDCKCCNDLGSSPKCQLFNTICIAALLIPLGAYGISVIFTLCPEWGDNDYEHQEHIECWDAVTNTPDMELWSNDKFEPVWE